MLIRWTTWGVSISRTIAFSTLVWYLPVVSGLAWFDQFDSVALGFGDGLPNEAIVLVKGGASGLYCILVRPIQEFT